MAVIIDRNECTSCGFCIDACSSKALSFDAENISAVDPDLCVECGACVDICPVAALTL